MKTKIDKTKSSNKGTSPFFNSKNDFGFFTAQPKLKVGQPGDKYEVEADRVADAVVNSQNENQPFFAPAQSNGFQAKSNRFIQEKPIAESITPLIQRQEEEEEELQTKFDSTIQKQSLEEEETVQAQPMEEEEEELQMQPMEEEEEMLQPKTDSSGQGTHSATEQLLNSSKGNGSSLNPEIQSQMEGSFGTDFSGVKIHTDSTAVQLNKELGAQAFTTGNNIYFNEGRYQPGSQNGKKLLAHELTHTIQQGANNDGSFQNQVVQRENGTIEFDEMEFTSTPDSMSEIEREWQAYRERVAGAAFDRAQQQFNDVIDATRQFRAFTMARIRARQPGINGADLFFAALGAIAGSIPGSGVAIELAKQIYRSERTAPSTEATLQDFIDQLIADVTTKTNNVSRRISQNVRTNSDWEQIIYDTWSGSSEPPAGDACNALGLSEYSDMRSDLLESLINSYFDLEVEAHPNRRMIRAVGNMQFGDPMGGYRIDARRHAARTYERE